MNRRGIPLLPVQIQKGRPTRLARLPSLESPGHLEDATAKAKGSEGSIEGASPRSVFHRAFQNGDVRLPSQKTFLRSTEGVFRCKKPVQPLIQAKHCQIEGLD